MKRYKIQRLGWLLLILSPLFSGQAQPVSSTVARSVAVNFMNRMYTDKTRAIQTFFREGANPMQAVTSNAATINIITFSQGGWVILSNDESAPPVLAFCESGSFSPDTNDMPGGLIELMQDYRDIVQEIRMDYTAKGSSADYSENQSAWGQLKNSQTKGKPATIYVDNLLKDSIGNELTWGQSWACNAERSYNKYMPKGYDLIGTCAYGRKHAGCGTVAMAQIMWYWKFPPQYEWNEMPCAITCNTSIYQVNYIAHLFKDCGKANNMNYLSCAGSFTTTEDLAQGLRNVQYSNANKLRKGTMGKKKWMAIIRSNLDAGRPMVYRGDRCDVCMDKHLWNITGYGSDDLFYCNWGWQGSHNGWFRLDSLKPGNSNYRVNNMIVRDIYPNWNVQTDGLFENITRGTDDELRAFNRNITLKNVTLTSNAQAKLCFTQTLTIEDSLTIGPNTSFILQSYETEAAASQAIQTDAYRGEDSDDLNFNNNEADLADASFWDILPPEIEEEAAPTMINNVWSLYPNPNQGSFEVQIIAPHAIRQTKTLSIYSPNGNLVYETDFEGGHCSVHGVGSKGLHLALLKTPEQTYVLKVLIK